MDGSDKGVYKHIKGEFFRTHFEPNLIEWLAEMSTVEARLAEVSLE